MFDSLPHRMCILVYAAEYNTSRRHCQGQHVPLIVLCGRRYRYRREKQFKVCAIERPPRLPVDDRYDVGLNHKAYLGESLT